MTYYYIYKITCTKGSFKDKFYFGQHTTNNLDDGYKGSGKKLQNYYKTYPDDYIKEIICFCDNKDDLGKAEYDIIHPYLGDTMCLNIVEGGKQSTWNKGLRNCYSNTTIKKMSLYRLGKEPAIKGKHLSEQTKQLLKQKCSGYLWINNGIEQKQVKPDELQNYLQNGFKKGRLPFSEEHNKKVSESLKNIPKEKHPMYGKKHSDKTIQKLKEIHKGLQAGENHPLYNKKKMVKGDESKFVHKDDIDKYIEAGWLLLRK